MEKQQNKALEEKLSLMRHEIDEIDDQILFLLEERIKVVGKVADLKKDNNESFFIRSSREADMIKDLLKKSPKNFPKSSIIDIWRKIITAANMHEQPLSILVFNPKNDANYNHLIKKYYNDEVKIENFDNAGNIISKMKEGLAQIAIFALPIEGSQDSNDNWWINLANNQKNIRVFATIPFGQGFINQNGDKIQLVAAAIKSAEKSQMDNSLLYFEVKKNFSKNDLISLFSELKLGAKILKTASLSGVEDANFYLIEVEDFLQENDQIINKIKLSKIKPYLKILGNYARSDT